MLQKRSWLKAPHFIFSSELSDDEFRNDGHTEIRLPASSFYSILKARWLKACIFEIISFKEP